MYLFHWLTGIVGLSIKINVKSKTQTTEVIIPKSRENQKVTKSLGCQWDVTVPWALSSTSSFPRQLPHKELLHILTFSLLGRGGSEALQRTFEQGGHLVSSIIMKVS